MIDQKMVSPIIENKWDTEKCFQNQSDIFKAIFEDIDSAKISIHMEMFIFSLDKLGNIFLQKLQAAALRGVQVKLIVDGVGSQDFDLKTIEKIKSPNFQIKVYQPIRWGVRKAIKYVKSFKFRSAFYSLTQLNKRNHRKLILIDKKIAWAGSANVSEKHSAWRETMVRVTGENVIHILGGFEWIWSLVGGIRKKKLPSINPIICNTLSRKYKRKTKKFRVNLINNAQRSIKIINPYVIPPTSFLFALLRARKRGVDVSILTTQVSDVFFVKWFSRSYYNILLKSGIKVFERQKSMLHSKVLIVDDKAILGTSNYNYRSLNLDLEIDILLSKPETIQSLNQQWDKDISLSNEIPKPPYSKFLNRLISFLNYLKINS